MVASPIFWACHLFPHQFQKARNATEDEMASGDTYINCYLIIMDLNTAVVKHLLSY